MERIIIKKLLEKVLAFFIAGRSLSKKIQKVK